MRYNVHITSAGKSRAASVVIFSPDLLFYWCFCWFFSFFKKKPMRLTSTGWKFSCIVSRRWLDEGLYVSLISLSPIEKVPHHLIMFVWQMRGHPRAATTSPQRGDAKKTLKCCCGCGQYILETEPRERRSGCNEVIYCWSWGECSYGEAIALPNKEKSNFLDLNFAIMKCETLCRYHFCS